MMDVLLKDGDIAVGSSGDYTYISGIDEAVQRVLISVLTVKGEFIYDRELGTDYKGLSKDDALLTEKLDMLFKEACCDISDTEVEVLSCDTESLIAEISVSYKGSITNTEVDLSGILREHPEQDDR